MCSYLGLYISRLNRGIIYILYATMRDCNIINLSEKEHMGRPKETRWSKDGGIGMFTSDPPKYFDICSRAAEIFTGDNYIWAVVKSWTGLFLAADILHSELSAHLIQGVYSCTFIKPRKKFNCFTMVIRKTWSLYQLTFKMQFPQIRLTKVWKMFFSQNSATLSLWQSENW